MENDFATGYALGSDNNGNNGLFGNEGMWGLIILALIFGGGRFGGGDGGGINYVMPSSYQGDIQRGFDTSAMLSKLDGITNGLCDGFYAVNNGMLQGFNGINTAMLQGFNQQTIAALQGQNALAAQLAACCCENRQGQADIKYQMATDTCAITNTMNTNTRDIIENQNAGTRAILDYLCQDKIAALQAENNDLRRAASQDRQSALLTTAMAAQTNQIIDTLRAPTPIPSYTVANPYTGVYGYGCNSGGCGC